ncbi:hypothetical protein DFH05DRAFT_1518045 [Lentinula detonsa]|uniref:Uncharacterized protein n=1 Tax=Lentinula detonsa TaxID=2804962 RepID=A0A9W8U2J6_9AGAR|nr:hypothetical protein DFH05DRAFT_1518045 [Lentinula detonsa]
MIVAAEIKRPKADFQKHVDPVSSLVVIPADSGNVQVATRATDVEETTNQAEQIPSALLSSSAATSPAAVSKATITSPYSTQTSTHTVTIQDVVRLVFDLLPIVDSDSDDEDVNGIEESFEQGLKTGKHSDSSPGWFLLFDLALSTKINVKTEDLKGNVAAVEFWVVESQMQDLEGLIRGFFGGRSPHPQSPFRPSPLSGHPTGASPGSYFPLVPSNADAMDMDMDRQHRQHQSQLRSPSTRSQSSTSLPGTPFDEGGPGGYLTATTNGVQEMNGNGYFSNQQQRQRVLSVPSGSMQTQGGYTTLSFGAEISAGYFG